MQALASYTDSVVILAVNSLGLFRKHVEIEIKIR